MRWTIFVASSRSAASDLHFRSAPGVHAGEPIADDDDLFGLQVNIASRINALAEPNEILVSSVIRDLSAPGRTEFSAPRSVTLKGIPGEITVCTANPHRVPS